MRRATSGVLLCGALLVASACGSGVSSPGTLAGSGQAPGGITESLAVVPDQPGASDFVVVNDLAAAAAAASLTPPPAGSSQRELAAYFGPLSGTGDSPVAVAPAPLLLTGVHDIEWRDELGFAPVDLTGDVTSGSPPDQLQTFFGDIDPNTVAAAVAADPVWSDELTSPPIPGQGHSFSWGQDNGIDPSRLTTVRRTGESSRLFVDDLGGAVAYWAHSTAVIDDAVDTWVGDAPSLADNPLIGPMAAALDDLGAYSAVLTTDAEQFAVGGELEPYDAVATGATVVDGQPRLLLVYANPDEATAQANAETLADLVADGESSANGRPWSDALGAGEIEVDGTLVTASFPTEDPRLWNGIFLQRDSLLATR